MNSALNILRDDLAKGPISFARFMELALYAPETGYYERQREIGRRGDFFTSVSVGKLFGELLAFQFAEWAEKSKITDSTGRIRIIEAGAHDGKLAVDILKALQKNHPYIFPRIEYCLLEPSSIHREWQAKTLSEFADQISWSKDWSDISLSEARPPRFSIVFSNELLDAMPAHRIRWDARNKTWQEMKVGWDGNDFVWVAENISAEIQDLLPVIPEQMKNVLPNSFSTEICVAALDWWKKAARHCDKIVAIDYGLAAEEFFLPHRSNGTLRCYFRHRLNADLLAHPGEQDITAHVNFSSLQQIGEAEGLKTCALTSQRRFLTEIASKMWREPEKFPWDQERTRQFQTLTHEEHLGRAFRVLIQEK